MVEPSGLTVAGADAAAVPVLAYCPAVAVPVALHVTDSPAGISTRLVWLPQSMVESSTIRSSVTVTVSGVLPLLVTW